MYLSNRHGPTGESREKLEVIVVSVSVQDAYLRARNAALEYLYKAPVEMTAERAKTQPLKLLQRKS